MQSIISVHAKDGSSIPRKLSSTSISTRVKRVKKLYVTPRIPTISLGTHPIKYPLPM